MKVRRPRSTFFAVSAACLLLAGAATLALTSPAAEPTAAPGAAAAFQVDGVHSSNVFRIKHAGVSNFYGRFNKMSGGFTFDPNALDTASIEATIETGSIDTANPGRDDHLRKAEYFDAATYPQITFKSTSVKKAADGKFDVAGDLTLKGVTKPITAKVEYFGEKDGGPRMGYRSGLEAQFTIKRPDFGVGAAGGGLGDDVLLIISLEGVKK